MTKVNKVKTKSHSRKARPIYVKNLDMLIRGRLSEVFLKIIGDSGNFMDPVKSHAMLTELKIEATDVMREIIAEWKKSNG